METEPTQLVGARYDVSEMKNMTRQLAILVASLGPMTTIDPIYSHSSRVPRVDCDDGVARARGNEERQSE